MCDVKSKYIKLVYDVKYLFQGGESLIMWGFSKDKPLKGNKKRKPFLHKIFALSIDFSHSFLRTITLLVAVGS